MFNSLETENDSIQLERMPAPKPRTARITLGVIALLLLVGGLAYTVNQNQPNSVNDAVALESRSFEPRDIDKEDTVKNDLVVPNSEAADALNVVPDACSTTNLALNKPAGQSSNWGRSHPAGLANDAPNSQHWQHCSHTKRQRHAVWWVDLGSSKSVCKVSISAINNGYSRRLSNYIVFVSNTKPLVPRNFHGIPMVPANTICGRMPHRMHPSQVKTFSCVKTGRYVGVQLRGYNYLQLCNVRVFGGNPLHVNRNLREWEGRTCLHWQHKARDWLLKCRRTSWRGFSKHMRASHCHKYNQYTMTAQYCRSDRRAKDGWMLTSAKGWADRSLAEIFRFEAYTITGPPFLKAFNLREACYYFAMSDYYRMTQCFEQNGNRGCKKHAAAAQRRATRCRS